MKSATIRKATRTSKFLEMTNCNMPRNQPHIIDEQLAGKTIAAALKHWQPELSWKAARELLAARRVMLNGTTCQDEARRINSGDLVEVADRPGAKPPQGKDLCIRFLDEHIVVVEKPAGMLTERPAAERVHRHGDAPREPSLDELLPKVISEYVGKRLRGDAGLIWIVHRLDRDASGLLVVARTPLARERLTQQFAARTPSRIYWAIVSGRLEPQAIRTHILRDRGDGKRGSVEHLSSEAKAALTKTMSVEHQSARPLSLQDEGQLAITHVKPLASRRGHTLLECQLETGRTNQIRIHLSELGHPICGDVKYGPVTTKVRPPRLALHAIALQFDHPTTGEPLQFEAEWPEELERFWDELPSRWS